jgi:hypothetical protein
VTGYEDEPEESAPEAKETSSAAVKDQGQPDAEGAAAGPPEEGSMPSTTSTESENA